MIFQFFFDSTWKWDPTEQEALRHRDNRGREWGSVAGNGGKETGTEPYNLRLRSPHSPRQQVGPRRLLCQCGLHTQKTISSGSTYL